MIEFITRFWPAMCLALAWGFAEATFFFLVPDVLLTLIALFAPGVAMAACLAGLTGALVGGWLVYSMSVRDAVGTALLVSRVPFVRQWMWREMMEHYDTVGRHAPRKGPRAGIPYKLYAAEAPRRMSLSRFMMISVPARVVRFVMTAGGCAAVGLLLSGPISRHRDITLLAHAAGWTLFYAVYWIRVTRVR